MGLGDLTSGSVYVDSSAALLVTQRKGNGKLRHVKIGQLWVQEIAEQEELAYRKVKGEANPADIGTKHLPRTKMDVLIPMISLRELEGRADHSLRI